MNNEISKRRSRQLEQVQGIYSVISSVSVRLCMFIFDLLGSVRKFS